MSSEPQSAIDFFREIKELSERGQASMEPVLEFGREVTKLRDVPLSEAHCYAIAETNDDLSSLVIDPARHILSQYQGFQSLDWKESVRNNTYQASQDKFRSIINVSIAHFTDPMVMLFVLAARARLQHLDNLAVEMVYDASREALRQHTIQNLTGLV